MVFINSSGFIGGLVELGINDLFGSWIAFGFILLVILIVISIALRINLLWLLLFLIPINLVMLAYGIIPFALGGVYMLVVGVIVAFSFYGLFTG